MKRLAAFFLTLAVATPAHALFGVGDLSFDPTTYGEVASLYKQTVELYDNAKKQLDSMASIEKTLKEAQQAYETLANTDLRSAAAGLRPDAANTKSAAGLRAELARMEGGVSQNSSYYTYQLSRIKQLENLELLQRASASNAQEATGKMNEATAARISAQAAASTAALAAAEEQRRVQEDMARQAAAKAGRDSMKDSRKLYKAMAK